MSFCAPSRGHSKSWTCFATDELETLIHAFNQTKIGIDNPIDVQKLKMTATNDNKSYKQKLWISLQNRFAPFCGDNEACWLDNVDLGKQLRSISPKAYEILNYFTLKPKGTKKKDGWLSTTEIDYVMQQYELVFPEFKYLGCFPSDYYILSPTKFPSKYLDTFEQAGLVFNLDSSHQKGSHWVAVFFDIDAYGNRTIEYFDPTGNPPNRNIKQFLNNPYFFDAELIISDKKHQKGNNECGMYSLYFILERIRGRSMTDINRKRIPDSDMNDFRSALFRPFSERFSW